MRGVATNHRFGPFEATSCAKVQTIHALSGSMCHCREVWRKHTTQASFHSLKPLGTLRDCDYLGLLKPLKDKMIEGGAGGGSSGRRLPRESWQSCFKVRRPMHVQSCTI